MISFQISLLGPLKVLKNGNPEKISIFPIFCLILAQNVSNES